jgi:hypothetical protein
VAFRADPDHIFSAQRMDYHDDAQDRTQAE